MRQIEGICCTAKFKDPYPFEYLFGPSTSKCDYSHQKFLVNGLVPYHELEAAKLALAELQRRKADLGFYRTGLAHINIRLTENDDEQSLLLDQPNLIIITKQDYGEYNMYGKTVKGVQSLGAMPLAELEENGFRPWQNFKYVTELQPGGVLYELRRQGRPVGSYLATFAMDRLKA